MESTLLTDYYFEGKRNFHYKFLNENGKDFYRHTHTFFEYFFIYKGYLTHYFNDKKELLTEGDLLLIRPQDNHGFEKYKNKKCEWINVSFTIEQFNLVCDYLQIDKNKMFLDENAKTKKHLTNNQVQYLYKEHEYLNFCSRDLYELEIQYKTVLFKTFKLFIKKTNDPIIMNNFDDLMIAFEKMNSQENLEKGVAALVEISGFSHGHLCKIMKEHFHTTPVKYVHDIRLLYASNLLAYSDLGVLEICQKSGYTSLSHFIKSFKEKFNLTPTNYRHIHSHHSNEHIF